MAEPQTWVKRPVEGRYYDMDFSAQPECDPTGNNENVASVVSVTIVTPTGGDSPGLSLGAPTFSGKRAQVFVTGGTSGYTYVLKYRVTTTGGATLEGIGRLYVLDIAA